jgi:hypothetical protein
MERAPMLAPWNDLAGTVLLLTRYKPELYQRLVCAPPRAFHSYAIYLRLEQLSLDEALAQHLLESDPLDLAREALPESTGDLLRCLGRLEPYAWSAGNYLKLDRLLRGRARDVLLQERFLTVAKLEAVARLEDCDPLVAAIMPKIGFEPGKSETFHLMFTLLRNAGALGSDADALNAMRKLDSNGIIRFFWRRLCKIRQTPIELRLPLTLRQVETLGELARLGHKYQNCLARPYEHFRDFLSGKTFFFEWRGFEGAVAQVENFCGAFYLRELRGMSNRAVDGRTRLEVETALKSAGVRIVGNSHFHDFYYLLEGLAFDLLDGEPEELTMPEKCPF